MTNEEIVCAIKAGDEALYPELWEQVRRLMLYLKGWFAENAVPCTDEPLGLKRAGKKLSGVASAALSSARSIANTLRPYPRKHYIRQSCSAFKPWPVTRMMTRTIRSL